MITTPIREEQAREFWRDLRGTLKYDPDGYDTHGIMSPELVASHMGIPTETASSFLWACVKYHITDRQGGGFVV